MAEPTPDIDVDRDSNATPLERTIRLVATHPEIHDHMAFNLWLYASDYWGNSRRGLEVWGDLSASDKQPWLDRVTDDLEARRFMTEKECRALDRLHMRGVYKRNDDALDAARTQPEGSNG